MYMMMMKKSSFGIICFALLCGFWMPSVKGQVGEYIITEKYDAILVDCAIAFLVLAIIFLILLLLTIFCVSRRIDEERTPHKTYQVSYRERDHEVRDISSPFYGHSVYSRRTTSIYLPGRDAAALSATIGTDGKPVKNVAYENQAAVMEVEGKRDSPPTEKGQKDSMVSEKSKTVKTVYDNSAYDIAGTSGSSEKRTTVKTETYDNSGYQRASRSDSHTYDSVDDTIRTTHTVRYTTTTVTTTATTKEA